MKFRNIFPPVEHLWIAAETTFCGFGRCMLDISIYKLRVQVFILNLNWVKFKRNWGREWSNYACISWWFNISPEVLSPWGEWDATKKLNKQATFIRNDKCIYACLRRGIHTCWPIRHFSVRQYHNSDIFTSKLNQAKMVLIHKPGFSVVPRIPFCWPFHLD